VCGRFVQFSPLEALIASFGIEAVSADISPDYNVAPTKDILAVIRVDGQNRLGRLRWGLVPSWSRDPAVGSRLINARLETAATKKSFRTAFRRRRCLIPADGFYEWKKDKGGKQPYFLKPLSGAPAAFAGLWEIWRSEAGQKISSCTILTTAASACVSNIHDRMPVALDPAAYGPWLDPVVTDPALLTELVAASTVTQWIGYPVARQVNSVKNNGAGLVKPLSDGLGSDA
jgi:putative SOS response-associated peptidase YedK